MLTPGAVPPGARWRSVRCGAVAVVSGEGLRELFHELGVHTIDGGPTLNPSTYDLLAGIHEVPAEEVVLLTNSANVIMAAEHAARLSDKQVLVAPTTSQQAGLAAAVALAPDRSVEENAQALTEALARVRTGAVAPAARDDAQGRFKRGEAVGFVEDEVLAWGEPRETLQAVLHALARGSNGDGPPELISVLAGRGGSARARRDRGDDQRRHRARAAPRRPAGLLVAASRRVKPAGDPSVTTGAAIMIEAANAGDQAPHAGHGRQRGD